MKPAVALAVFLSSLLGFAQSPADNAHVIRFNTACAYCHEGQCSGRMSFALDAKAAFDHVRRYAGFVDDCEAGRLVAALAYMKERCAYLPLAALEAEVSDAALLAAYRNPASGDYFLPLGVLSAGRYHLRLDFAGPAAPAVEVLNEFFELVADPRPDARARHLFAFGIIEAASHYVRLRLADPVTLTGLQLVGPVD